MNWNTEAFKERERNKQYIRVEGEDGKKLLVVDTKKVTYLGFKWADLGDYGKRKFDNLLVFENMKGHTQIRYV